MNQFVNYNQIALWTENFGDNKNTPILLIAGAHAPSIFWPDFFCKKLADAGYFVVRYDHRDIGYSTHFPATNDVNKPVYTLRDLMDDAIHILEAYQVKRAYIVGHSMGASIVQYLLAYYPERILKGISLSVSVDSSTQQHPRFNAVMQELMKNHPTGNFEMDWPQWMHSWKLLNGTLEMDEVMARHYTRCIYERHAGDFHPAWNHMAAHNTKEIVMDRLPKDLLLINGDEDVLSPAKEITKLKERFKIEILSGAGHVFFNRAIWNSILAIVLRDFEKEKQDQSVKHYLHEEML